ncbi:MAG: efflux RND transporter periplasmic adaptor subunit [Pseudomonadota bacterium]
MKGRGFASALLGLLALTLTACGGATQDSAGANGSPPVGPSVRVTGEIQSAESAYFGPPAIPDVWNYTIAYMAPDGMPVQTGRPVLRFDTQDLMTRLRDKSNALNEKQKELERTQIVSREVIADLALLVQEAQADLEKARLKADIPEDLLAAREYRENQLLLNKAELVLALRQEELAQEKIIQATEVKILQREVAVLEGDVGRFRGSIDSMTLKAPRDGVVIHVRDRRNNKMSVGDNVWGGRRVIEFPDLEQLEAHIEIPERESARIRIGQQVRFTLDAAPDTVFLGEVTDLASVVHTRSINQPDKVFDARVRLLNPDPELMRPGMNINAEVLIDSATEVAGL